MLLSLLRDLRFAVRWLIRSPGFTLAAVICLAVGIGVNTALYSIVDALLFRPLPVKEPGRLVDIYTSGNDGDPYSTSSYPDFLDLRAGNDVFDDMIAFSPMISALNLGDRSRLLIGELVTGNYFGMLGIRAALGRTLLPDDDRPGAERVVMVSDRFWRKELGGDTQVTGRTLRIQGRLYTIVGVAPPYFTGLVPILSAELWLPALRANDVQPAGIQESVPSPTGTTRLERRGDRWMFLKGRLRTGVLPEQARANLSLLMGRLAQTYPQTNKGRSVSALPTSEVRIHPSASTMLKTISTGLMAAVGLALLVACANVASMLLARASVRRREIGIRMALGAGRGRLVRQLLVESLTLASIGSAAGILLAWWLLRFIGALQPPIPVPVSLDLRIDMRVLIFALAATLLAGLAAGLAPALRASRWNIMDELRGSSVSVRAGRRWTLRDALVMGQVAVTLVLLVGSGLLVRSLAAARRADVGFRSAGLAVVSADPSMVGYDAQTSRRFWDQAQERVRRLPGVDAVAMASRLPFSVNFSVENFYIPGYDRTADPGTPILYARVSPSYFSTMGIPILQGRGFAESDTADTPAVAVVNETAARRFWPGSNPIGRRIQMHGSEGAWCQVVGVAADHRLQTVGESAQPYVHLASTQRPDTYNVLVARTGGDAGRLLAELRQQLLDLEPNLVFLDNQTMDVQIGVTLFPVQAGAWVVGLVGVVAIGLASIGLYGVISFSVSRRVREIGIRMALGAGRPSVIALVMRQGLSVALVGLLVGCLLGAGAARILAGTLYGVSAGDALAWCAAIGILFSASALANFIPARRAARVDPSAAMRIE